jgi:hypothetical protein
MMSFVSRRELLAGYNGQFQTDGMIGHAVAMGNLSDAVWFARQLAVKEPITSAECAEHDLALEFLAEFDHAGGFDAYVAAVTDNDTSVGEDSQLSVEEFSVRAYAALDLIAA